MDPLKAEVTSDDDQTRFIWPLLGYAISFDGLKESSDGLHGRMLVQTTQTMNNGRTGHVAAARVNVDSLTSRASTAKYLNGRISDVDWVSLLEIACTRTGELFRRGEPFVDLHEVEATPEVPYLLRALVPAGETTVLFAPAGSAKSYLALAAGLAVATGQPIGQLFHPSEQQAVLYLDWETQATTHARRLGWLCQGIDLPNRPHIFYRRQHRPIADDILQIKDFVRKNGIQFVIVDSLGPASGGEQETAVASIRALNALRRLGDDVTVLVISHVTKQAAGQERGQAKPFGSIFVENLARVCWELRRASSRVGSTLDLGLFCTKINDGRPPGPFGARVSWEETTGRVSIQRIDISGDEDLMAHGTNADQILAYLRASVGAQPTGAISEATGIAPNTCRATLSRLHKDQKVRRIGNQTGGQDSGFWLPAASE